MSEHENHGFLDETYTDFFFFFCESIDIDINNLNVTAELLSI